MANISKTHNISRPRIISGKLTMLLLMLLAVCVFSRPAKAETSIYVFDPNQSTVVKTGGFAGAHETYAITGQFRLTVNSYSGVASFEMVDANLADETGAVYGRSLNEIFNMTGLAGTVVNYKTIEFEGKTDDGTESNVSLSLKLSIKDDSAHLTGKTTPPPNSADMFFYDVNTVAVRKYAGGTGEPNEPYQIATAEDLMLLGETPEDYDKHFILTADIDLDPNLPGRKIFDKTVIAQDVNDGWGFQGTAFTGVFDGNNHAISHLTIIGESSLILGLFGEIGIEAKISNLGLEDLDINGTDGYVGGLVGHNYGIITNCYCNGTIRNLGSWFVGGLVGENYGSMSGCYSMGAISGYSLVGGLVGYQYNGTIACSFSTAAITGNRYVGGLVASNGNGGIITCYSSGTVTGIEYVGGIAGCNNDYIANSYSTGMVTGDNVVGGLVGRNGVSAFYDRPVSLGTILNCYSTGVVSGNINTGGLVGRHEEGDVNASFWDTLTSGWATSAGGTGKTTAEMQIAGTFLEAGWDFVGETDNGTEDIWSICEGTNYPRFVWQIVPGDFICPDGITIDDFSFFMEHWLDDNCGLSNGYCQGTDLDQSGTVDAYDLEIFFANWPDE